LGPGGNSVLAVATVGIPVSVVSMTVLTLLRYVALQPAARVRKSVVLSKARNLCFCFAGTGKMQRFFAPLRSNSTLKSFRSGFPFWLLAPTHCTSNRLCWSRFLTSFHTTGLWLGLSTGRVTLEVKAAPRPQVFSGPCRNSNWKSRIKGVRCPSLHARSLLGTTGNGPLITGDRPSYSRTCAIHPPPNTSSPS